MPQGIWRVWLATLGLPINLREQIIQKDVEISEMKTKINDLNKLQHDQKALYLKGSNLDDKLYK